MFVDRVTIEARAGHGGSGSASFRREMFVPRGGPDGGDGGAGGDVVFVASANERSLVDLRFQKLWKAERGGDGAGRKRHGADGRDCRVRVPVGTLVFDAATDELLCDLREDRQEFVACRGGRGGQGNVHYLSSTNRAPRRFQPGEDGEERTLDLELKTIADVGLVGFPNAGKSTLLAAVSDARPRTAPYPFTTLHPKVGLIEMPDFARFTIADIPGLIEGAHENLGLGHAFLRHIERCHVLCFVLDMAGTDGRDPLDDLAALRTELALYDAELEARPYVIVANKMDMPEAARNLERLLAAEDPARVFPTCAELAEHTDRLVQGLHDLLRSLPPMDETALERILRKRHGKGRPEPGEDAALPDDAAWEDIR